MVFFGEATENEKLMYNTLSGLSGYVSLSLHPPTYDNTIRKSGNIAFINEGRDGKFTDISERFYDLMVDMFDSRYKNKN